MATEAATYRGTDAVAAGLADAVTDLTRGFGAFRQLLAQRPSAAIARATPSIPHKAITHPRKERTMANAPDPEETQQEERIDVQSNDPPDTAIETPAADTRSDTSNAAAAPAPAPAPAPAAAITPQVPPEPAPTSASEQASASPQHSNLAELSAQLRQEAAEITEIAAQAGRLGIAIDAAKALREGTTPEALRRLVIERASAAADARDIVAAPPSPVLPQAQESPIVAAAKRAAATGTKA